MPAQQDFLTPHYNDFLWRDIDDGVTCAAIQSSLTCLYEAGWTLCRWCRVACGLCKKKKNWLAIICQTIHGEISEKALKRFDVYARRIRSFSVTVNYEDDDFISSHVFFFISHIFDLFYLQIWENLPFCLTNGILTHREISWRVPPAVAFTLCGEHSFTACKWFPSGWRLLCFFPSDSRWSCWTSSYKVV